jgi:hypothetical protein
VSVSPNDELGAASQLKVLRSVQQNAPSGQRRGSGTTFNGPAELGRSVDRSVTKQYLLAVCHADLPGTSLEWDCQGHADHCCDGREDYPLDLVMYGQTANQKISHQRKSSRHSRASRPPDATFVMSVPCYRGPGLARPSGRPAGHPPPYVGPCTPSR